MPEIIIKDRMDRTGPVKLTLGANHRQLPRNEKVIVSKSELEVLMHSHEANHIFVLAQETSLLSEEVDNGSVDRAERPDPDTGGDEEGPWQGRVIG